MLHVFTNFLPISFPIIFATQRGGINFEVVPNFFFQNV